MSRATDEAPIDLLFCTNCSLSIPALHVQTGIAKRERGVWLCSDCLRADMNGRAIRRQALEEEMADEVELPVPVPARARRTGSRPPRAKRVAPAAAPPAEKAEGNTLERRVDSLERRLAAAESMSELHRNEMDRAVEQLRRRLDIAVEDLQQSVVDLRSSLANDPDLPVKVAKLEGAVSLLAEQLATWMRDGGTST